MNRFLTLVRRDLADYRGALVWTPVVVAVIVFALALVASMAGRFDPGFNLDKLAAASESGQVHRDPETGRITVHDEDGSRVTVDPGPDGNVTVTDETGSVAVDLQSDIQLRDDVTLTFDGVHTPEEIKAVRTAGALGPSVGALLPLGIASVVVLFVFLGSLYDERKDRSILFWKSMPAGDYATVLSRALTIGVLGLGIALLAGFALHIGLNLITFTILAQHGFGWFGLDTVGLMLEAWGLMAFAALIYLLWVAPVYSWLLFASAASPKAPIILGLVPFALVPLAALVVGVYNEWLMEPVARLTGQPMAEAFGMMDFEREFGPDRLDFAPIYQALAHSLTQPGLWIGLLVAAGLLYATAEVRRRKAL